MKTMKAIGKALAITLTATLMAPSWALASESWMMDLSKSNTKVDFHADGKIMKVHGENGKASGKLIIKDGSVSGQAVVNLNDLTTGIDLRDDHMKNKYLEVGKYPKATLDIIEIRLPAQLPSGSFEAPFKGNLTVHGVSKAVSGVAKLNRDGSQLKGDVEFMTSISGHKIELPKYSGIILKDEVKVKVEFDGTLTKADGKPVAKK